MSNHIRVIINGVYVNPVYKIIRTKDKIEATDGKRSVYWTGGITHTLTDDDIYKILDKKWNGKIFKLNFPSIGKPIEKYWDVDYNAWTEGFSIWGINFLKHHTFNKTNRYRISLKKPKPYDIKKYANL